MKKISNENILLSKKCGNFKYISRKYMPLAAGIIEQAVKDYRKSLLDGRYEKADAERKWFLSEWGQLLSNNSGKLIIDRIDKEVEAVKIATQSNK